MLKYNGKLFFDTPLTDDEVSFLNSWQQKLVDIYEKYSKAATKKEKEEISAELDTFSGISLSNEQKWTIFFAMSPMIKFTNKYISVKGAHKKGNIREAILSYQHFFLGENPVIAECMNFKFGSAKTLTGIIECEKKQYEEKTNWCYLFENNQIYSIDATNKKTFETTPQLYEKALKEDTFKVKLDKYFPPIIAYATLKKQLSTENRSVSSKRKNKI
jgi:hypothetical protein